MRSFALASARAPLARLIGLGTLAVGLVLAGSGALGGSAVAAGSAIYVSPSGSDSNPGTQAQPIQTLQKAQQMVRSMNQGMTSDVVVTLEDGYYRLSSPLTLDASDSGSGGHNVVWTAAAGARPVVMGSAQITGWTLHDAAHNIWVAQGPSGIQTRQLYVDGARATRATGGVPSAATLSGWRDPSGQWPPRVEFVYKGGTGAWAEPRCDVASATASTITMDEPCWANSTQRGTNHVGGGSVGGASSAENAYALLSSPGEWYLDTGDSKFYYIPLPGQTNLNSLDVEAPALNALVTGGGTAAAPLHNVVFDGIEFAYATWMGASSKFGFSEVQANYLNQGSSPTAENPLFNWYQTPADVALTYDQNIQFTNDAFIHLGGAGVGLGDGSQNDQVVGSVFTDVSANTIEVGNVDMPQATGNSQVVNNTIQDNYIHDAQNEFHGGIGIDVGYAIGTTVAHNQVDNLPYSGMSIGWGGWPDKGGQPGIANFSHNNVITNNLVYNIVTYLSDGAAIYSNGQTGSSFATGEHITNNVLHDQPHIFHLINTDNGTDWMTVTGNAVWNPGLSNSWGYCHTDYYPGEGGGLDHENVSGNWWDNRSGNGSHGQLPTSTGNCSVQNNTNITGPSQVPASVLSAAGLEASYQSLLNWQQVPPPPVGGHPPPTCSPTMSAPTGVTGTAGTGQDSWTWTAPANDCNGPATFYAVYVWGADRSQQMLESSTSSITVSPLTTGTYYTVTVTAFDGMQWSAWSNWSNWTLTG